MIEKIMIIIIKKKPLKKQMINKNKWKLAKIIKIYPLNIHKRSQRSY